ncbi:MAG: capsular polysaccharide export protein, LipB/KpsS family [Sphingomicrobium sp.]
MPGNHVLVRSAAALGSLEIFAGHDIVLWDADESWGEQGFPDIIRGPCDPWHMLAEAVALVIEDGDELRVIAALMGVDCHVWDSAAGELKRCHDDAQTLLKGTVSAAYGNPFTGASMSVHETVELCAFWRCLIDDNRDIAGGIGFAFWKQSHVAPLLWNGSRDFKFLRNAIDVRSGDRVAVWRSKASIDAVDELERKNVPILDVEDGFLRSRGLGADCIPPLSITVDRMCAYFDPSRASDLENMLEIGRFDEQILSRARDLRRVIVEEGIGKYERGTTALVRPLGDRRVILVPGQVEDDRAVTAGGCGLVSNLELLRRVRERAPDAFIIYKPHPDVIAGHRRGSIPDRLCLQYADEIVSGSPIASVIAIADEVHVNTSLAGFEALLRGKFVTTYGVPFYAGWGLTRDLGPVPKRRTARRSIDELVAAALLLYPRYLDPVTRLPCPAEVVVDRLTSQVLPGPGVFVGMRRLQGRLARRLRSIMQ